jgi:hypothetical protein
METRALPNEPFALAAAAGGALVLEQFFPRWGQPAEARTLDEGQDLTVSAVNDLPPGSVADDSPTPGVPPPSAEPREGRMDRQSVHDWSEDDPQASDEPDPADQSGDDAFQKPDWSGGLDMHPGLTMGQDADPFDTTEQNSETAMPSDGGGGGGSQGGGAMSPAPPPGMPAVNPGAAATTALGPGTASPAPQASGLDPAQAAAGIQALSSAAAAVNASPHAAGNDPPVSATEGAQFFGAVATFTTTNPGPFSATINWGDGTATSPGQVVSNGNNNYTVNAQHTYGEEGSFTVTCLTSRKSCHF